MNSLKIYLLGVFLQFMLISCSDKQNIESLIFKGNIAYKTNSDVPYTGQVFELFENGKKNLRDLF